MTTVSEKLKYAESLLKETSEEAKSFPEDRSREKIKYPEEKPSAILQYYDSHVKNSHLYPNFEYFRPFEENYIAGDNSKIQKEAFDNEIFQIGGLSLKRKDLPPVKPIWF